MYPKLHHGSEANGAALASLNNGWAREWRDAGAFVVGWGWVEGDPVKEAELAVGLCEAYDLDGYVADAEDPYEGAGKAKSEAFVARFRELAPRAPLGLSHIGLGVSYRDLDWAPWLDAGAVFMPQCYWSTSAISITGPLACEDAVPVPRDRVFPTLGTSAFDQPYPADQYARELAAAGVPGFNVWLLDSTTDDYLQALAPAIGG